MNDVPAAGAGRGPRPTACAVLLLGAALLLTAGAPGVAHAGRLAVFRIDPLGVDAQIVARLEGLLRLELGRLVDAAMPSPAQLQEALRKRPALRECTGDVKCLSAVGRLLGVERIISGNVGGLGESYVLNLKLVDVGEAKELRRIQEPISGRPDELIEAVRVAAYGLVAPERLRGALAVLADQPGAEVFLDGKLLGRTPLATIHGLAVGTYALRLAKVGYSEVNETVRVRFQKTAQLVVKLEAPRLRAAGPQPAPRRVERPVPWYTRWWFWAAVGAVAAGAGAALGYAFTGTNRGINCDAEPARCR